MLNFFKSNRDSILIKFYKDIKIEDGKNNNNNNKANTSSMNGANGRDMITSVYQKIKNESNRDLELKCQEHLYKNDLFFEKIPNTDKKNIEISLLEFANQSGSENHTKKGALNKIYNVIEPKYYDKKVIARVMLSEDVNSLLYQEEEHGYKILEELTKKLINSRRISDIETIFQNKYSFPPLFFVSNCQGRLVSIMRNIEGDVLRDQMILDKKTKIQEMTLDKKTKIQEMTLYKKFNIIKAILKSVSIIHYHKILHLDLKPENMIIDNQNHVTLIDFGNSFQVNEDGKFIVKNKAYGTSQYMSPQAMRRVRHSSESENKELNFSSDLWSLGNLIIEILTFPDRKLFNQWLDKTLTGWEYFNWDNEDERNKQFNNYYTDVLEPLLNKKYLGYDQGLITEIVEFIKLFFNPKNNNIKLNIEQLEEIINKIPKATSVPIDIPITVKLGGSKKERKINKQTNKETKKIKQTKKINKETKKIKQTKKIKKSKTFKKDKSKAKRTQKLRIKKKSGKKSVKH